MMSSPAISFSQTVVDDVREAVRETFHTKILGPMPLQEQTQMWTLAMEELKDQLVRSDARESIPCIE
jgi:hypothetical protein